MKHLSHSKHLEHCTFILYVRMSDTRMAVIYSGIKAYNDTDVSKKLIPNKMLNLPEPVSSQVKWGNNNDLVERIANN